MYEINYVENLDVRLLKFGTFVESIQGQNIGSRFASRLIPVCKGIHMWEQCNNAGLVTWLPN
jgi:hypothetical protein